LQKPLNASIGKIKTKSMIFQLAGDLEEAGQAFLKSLLDVFEQAE
jgi:hypothetical protein